MALSEKLQYLITVNADGAVRSFQNVGKAADKELGKAENRMDALGSKFTKFGVGALATAGVAAAGLWKLGEGASDLAETVSKSNVVFGDAAATIDEFGTSAAKAIGQSKVAAMDAAATFGTFGKSAGKTGQDLAKFSIDMVKLSSDMASFSNTTPEEAVMAIGAALRGESEPIRKYGVLLNDATLKNRAMELGIFDGVGALNAQQKVLAAQAEILAQTGDAQGDFARTSDGLANQQRIFAAELQNTKDTIGAAVLPAMQTLVGAAGDVFGAFNALPTGVQSAVGSVAGFGVAALGVVGVTSTVIGQLIKMRDSFTTLNAATGARSLTTFSKTLGVVGLAIGAAAVGYAAYNDRKEAAEQTTRDFTEALKSEAAGQKGATDAYIANLVVTDKNLKLYKQMGISVGNVARALKGEQIPALSALRSSMQGFGGTLNEFETQFGVTFDQSEQFWRSLGTQTTAVATSRGEYKEFTEAQEELAEQQDRAEYVTSRLAAAHGNLATSTGELTAATEDGTDADDEAAKARREVAEATDLARESARKLVNAETDLYELRYGALQNQEAFVVLMGETAAVLDDSKASVDEQYKAVKELAVAYGGLNGEAEGTPGHITRQIENLTNFSNTLAPDSPLRKRLAEYIAELAGIQRDIQTNVNIRYGSSGNVTGGPAGAPPHPGGRDGNPRTPYPMAEGGVVMPRPGGTPAILGEAGRPEAVIPLDRAGNMLNGTGSAGNTINVTINTAADPNAVVDAIRRWQRFNGPL